jgi:hypothetical protein
MSGALNCPVCNSSNEKISTSTQIVKNSWFGIAFEYHAVTNTCSWCGAEGDFDGINDIKITEAINQIQSDFGHEYIDAIMDDNKLSPVCIDRLLGLNIGSTSKLRNTNMSQIEFLFFKIMKEYPQLINILNHWRQHKKDLT